MAYAMRGREAKSHVSIAADAATTRWVFAHVAFAAVAPRPPHQCAKPLLMCKTMANGLKLLHSVGASCKACAITNETGYATIVHSNAKSRVK